MSKELRACPKCGGTDCGLVRLHEVGGLVWHRIDCRTCGTHLMWKISVDEAVDDWNRRAQS